MKRRKLLKACSLGALFSWLPKAIANLFEDSCKRDTHDQLVCQIPDNYEIQGCRGGYNRDTNQFDCLVEEFPGLMVTDESWIWDPGWAGLRLVYESGVAMVGSKGKEKPYQYDFYVQFRQIGVGMWGRPVYMQLGHADGRIFLVGGYPPASYNGGVELWVTNSELPLGEAALAPDHTYEKSVYFGEKVEIDFKAMLEELDTLLADINRLKQEDIEQHTVQNLFNHTINQDVNDNWWSRQGYKFELADAETLKGNVENQTLEMLGGEEPLEKVPPNADEEDFVDYFRKILRLHGEFLLDCTLKTGPCLDEVITRWIVDAISWVFETFEHAVISTLEFLGVTKDESVLIEKNLAAGMDEDTAQAEAFREAAVNEFIQRLAPDVVLIIFPLGTIGNLFKGGVRFLSKIRTPIIKSIVSVRYVDEAAEFAEELNNLIRIADKARLAVYEFSRQLAEAWDIAQQVGGVHRTLIEAVAKGHDKWEVTPQAAAELAAMQREVKILYNHIMELYNEAKLARHAAWQAQQEAASVAHYLKLPNPFAKSQELRSYFSELKIKEGKKYYESELEEFVKMNVTLEEYRAMQKVVQDSLEYLPKDHVMIKISGVHEGGKLFNLLKSREVIRDEYFWARVERGRQIIAADKAHSEWLQIQEHLAQLREGWKAAPTPELRKDIEIIAKVQIQKALGLARKEQRTKSLLPLFEGKVKEANNRLSLLNSQIVERGDTALWGGKPLQGASTEDWVAYRRSTLEFGTKRRPRNRGEIARVTSV